MTTAFAVLAVLGLVAVAILYRGCTARGCDCDTPLEDLPTVGDGAG